MTGTHTRLYFALVSDKSRECISLNFDVMDNFIKVFIKCTCILSFVCLIIYSSCHSSCIFTEIIYLNAKIVTFSDHWSQNFYLICLMFVFSRLWLDIFNSDFNPSSWLLFTHSFAAQWYWWRAGEVPVFRFQAIIAQSLSIRVLPPRLVLWLLSWRQVSRRNVQLAFLFVLSNRSWPHWFASDSVLVFAMA